eukprot:1830200-Prymnesium_polylepis.1
MEPDGYVAWLRQEEQAAAEVKAAKAAAEQAAPAVVGTEAEAEADEPAEPAGVTAVPEPEATILSPIPAPALQGAVQGSRKRKA